MADDRDDHLHECPECGRTYDSETSLMFCCNPRAIAHLMSTERRS